jgi:site-specific recombinase
MGTAANRDIKSILIEISQYEGKDIDLLVKLVYAVRPTKKQIKKNIYPSFDELIYWLNDDGELKTGLKSYLDRLIISNKLSYNLSDSNIIAGINFARELKNRISYKILPNLPAKDTIDHLLVNVFYKEIDGKWITALNDDKCKALMDILGYKGLYEYETDSPVIQEMLFAVSVLSHRITGFAFDREVLSMVPEYANLESPFAALQDEVDFFLQKVTKNEITRNRDEIHIKHLYVLVSQCRDFIKKAYVNKDKYGISFRVHQQLMLIERLLDRFVLVMDLLTVDKEKDSKTEFIRLIKTLINFNSGKSRVKEYINKSTQLMANVISKNIGKKGEKYITVNSSEYWGMFRSALGGGAIVAFAAISKLKLSEIDTSLIGSAFFYSMNYALAFIAIYLFHFTLATKQPAMTAANLASVIDTDLKENNGFRNLSIQVARVFRSQFIAFIGNSIMAFAVAMLFVMSWDILYDISISQKKAVYLINDLNIFITPVLFHAGIAGFFLFLSGLIAGNVYNKTRYRRIPERIRSHPGLKIIMNYKLRNAIANFYEKHMGSISSNFWFGVFMGSVGVVGIILGLNLDIRHIAFAAGEFCTWALRA